MLPMQRGEGCKRTIGFKGQSQVSFAVLKQLAQAADAGKARALRSGGQNGHLQLFVFPMGVSHEFAAPIGTDGAHLLNAARANCALVAAEKGLILPGKWSAAFFTFRFHFQAIFSTFD